MSADQVGNMPPARVGTVPSLTIANHIEGIAIINLNVMEGYAAYLRDMEPGVILSPLSVADVVEGLNFWNCENIHRYTAALRGMQDIGQQAGPVDDAVQAKIQGNGTAEREVDANEASVDDYDVEGQADDQAPPAYVDPPPYDGPLACVYTIGGTRANIFTPTEEFITWADYKLMCLATSAITVVFEDFGGLFEYTCSRKILNDFSTTLGEMDVLRGGMEKLNLTNMFRTQPIRSTATTFPQLYELILTQGHSVHVHNPAMTFMALIDLHMMAHLLGMTSIKNWLTNMAQMKIEHMSKTWVRDFDQALSDKDQVPGPGAFGMRNDINVGPFFLDRLNPIQRHLACLLDIQDAFFKVRNKPTCTVVLPSNLALLVATACPRLLENRALSDGDLQPRFIRAVNIARVRLGTDARDLRAAAGGVAEAPGGSPDAPGGSPDAPGGSPDAPGGSPDGDLQPRFIRAVNIALVRRATEARKLRAGGGVPGGAPGGSPDAPGGSSDAPAGEAEATIGLSEVPVDVSQR